MMIAGRALKLVFTTAAWIEIEERYGSIEALSDKMESGDKTVKTAIDAIAILANQGEGLAGRPMDVTAEWIAANIKPNEIKAAIAEFTVAIQKGMGMEAEQEENEPVDVVLEEIAKKKEQGS